jgi:hypothetical protein
MKRDTRPVAQELKAARCSRSLKIRPKRVRADLVRDLSAERRSGDRIELSRQHQGRDGGADGHNRRRPEV